MKNLKNFEEFVNEEIMHGGTHQSDPTYKSADDNKRIAMNIVNIIKPVLQQNGFDVKEDLSGNPQTTNLTNLATNPAKLALIATYFSVGWDGQNRSGGIHVYVSKTNLPALQQVITTLDHPFVKMGNKAYYYGEEAGCSVLYIFDDGVETPVPTPPTAPVPAT